MMSNFWHVMRIILGFIFIFALGLLIFWPSQKMMASVAFLCMSWVVGKTASEAALSIDALVDAIRLNNNDDDVE